DENDGATERDGTRSNEPPLGRQGAEDAASTGRRQTLGARRRTKRRHERGEQARGAIGRRLFCRTRAEQLALRRRGATLEEPLRIFHVAPPFAFVSFSTSVLNMSLPRRSRDATVPRGTSTTCAISGLVIPSSSKRTNTVRTSMGIASSTRSSISRA